MRRDNRKAPLAKSETIFLYGFHSVLAVLEQTPARVEELLLLSGRKDDRIQSILQIATSHSIPIQYLSRDQLDQTVHAENHQGIVAQVHPQQAWQENDLFTLLDQSQSPPFLLVLDGVQDPHNLGACLRSAEAAGVQAVIVPQDRSVGLTPVVRKVASGAAETVPFVTVKNLSRCLEKLQSRGIWILGLTDQAEEIFFQHDLKGPIALVLGAEGPGLRRLTKEYCDYLFRLPMKGAVSSLNVSVATGICLFEVVRQRLP